MRICVNASFVCHGCKGIQDIRKPSTYRQILIYGSPVHIGKSWFKEFLIRAKKEFLDMSFFHTFKNSVVLKCHFITLLLASTQCNLQWDEIIYTLSFQFKSRSPLKAIWSDSIQSGIHFCSTKSFLGNKRWAFKKCFTLLYSVRPQRHKVKMAFQLFYFGAH